MFGVFLFVFWSSLQKNFREVSSTSATIWGRRTMRRPLCCGDRGQTRSTSGRPGATFPSAAASETEADGTP